MDWIYTIDVESEEPIMLINRHIGYDVNDGMGIDGSLFQSELLRLDTLGKKRIQIWISSEGGLVMDGYKIYNAILKSKTKVDTYNIGIAASIAAVIFQAGRRRIMADYSLLMYHNPSGGDSTELKKMRESIAIMISERTGNSKDEVLKMMDRTTWISASEALATGFCDEIEYTRENNVKHGNAKAMWESGYAIANSLQKPINKTEMNKIANKLGLNPEASEDAIISEITNVVNKKNTLEDKMAKLEDEYNAAKEKCNKLEEEMEEMKAKMKKAEDEKKMAEDESKKMEAKNMVDLYAKSGKIKIESVNTWVDKAMQDFDGVKNLLESLPTNGKAVTISTTPVVNDAELTMVAAKAMSEVRAKLHIH